MISARRTVRCLAGFGCILLLFLFSTGRPNAAPDVVVTDIEFRIFPKSAIPALGERQAILGDKVRIWAVLTSRGGSAGEFNVAFSYLEETTKETAQIGKQTVTEIPQDEVRRVPQMWDTSELIPGRYGIIVVADPEGALKEGDGQRCNNVIPRGKCDNEPAKRGEQYYITILKQGFAISPPSVSESIPPCPMGQVTQSVAVLFINLGTEKITSVGITGSYRLSISGRWDPLDYVIIRSGPSAQNPVQPGASGTISATIDYEAFSRSFTNHGLGQSNSLQLKLEVIANGEKVADILVPEVREQLLHIYPSVDRWTFPRRSGCAWTAKPGEVEQQPGETVKVAPAVSPSGETVYHVILKDGQSSLVALSTDAGRQLWEFAGFGKEVGSPTVGKDSEGNEVIYLSSSDGDVFAVTAKDKGGELRWKGPDRGIGRSLTKPVVVLDTQGRTKMIYIGSDTGLHAIDPEGNLKWSYTQDDTTPIQITQPPLIVTTKGTATTICFASGGSIYNVGEDGKKVASQLFSSASPISTPLKLLPLGDKNYIYFGVDNGEVYVVDEASLKRVGDPIRLVGGKVTGIRVTKEGNSKHVIFATTADGTIYRLEFKGDKLEKTAEASFTREIESELDVFTDAKDQALAVLVTSKKGELRAISPDLSKVLKVKIWGEEALFSFDTKDKPMTSPVVDPLNKMVLVGSEDGFLYAFDLSQFK
jgi:outer membrane protein assembly factor BamB